MPFATGERYGIASSETTIAISRNRVATASLEKKGIAQGSFITKRTPERTFVRIALMSNASYPRNKPKWFLQKTYYV